MISLPKFKFVNDEPTEYDLHLPPPVEIEHQRVLREFIRQKSEYVEAMLWILIGLRGGTLHTCQDKLSHSVFPDGRETWQWEGRLMLEVDYYPSPDVLIRLTPHTIQGASKSKA